MLRYMYSACLACDVLPPVPSAIFSKRIILLMVLHGLRILQQQQ
jgi:hypothetical protein